MLLVKTFLANSQIDGFGLFADQFIPAGTVVWRFVPGVDALMEPEQVDALSPVPREYFQKYAYLDLRVGKYVICGDDARFMNHSTTPNLRDRYPPGELYGLDTAVIDIQPGEELTSDYSAFDKEFVEKLQIKTNAIHQIAAIS